MLLGPTSTIMQAFSAAHDLALLARAMYIANSPTVGGIGGRLTLELERDLRPHRILRTTRLVGHCDRLVASFEHTWSCPLQVQRELQPLWAIDRRRFFRATLDRPEERSVSLTSEKDR